MDHSVVLVLPVSTKCRSEHVYFDDNEQFIDISAKPNEKHMSIVVYPLTITGCMPRFGLRRRLGLSTTQSCAMNEIFRLCLAHAGINEVSLVDKAKL